MAQAKSSGAVSKNWMAWLPPASAASLPATFHRGYSWAYHISTRTVSAVAIARIFNNIIDLKYATICRIDAILIWRIGGTEYFLRIDCASKCAGGTRAATGGRQWDKTACNGGQSSADEQANYDVNYFIIHIFYSLFWYVCLFFYVVFLGFLIIATKKNSNEPNMQIKTTRLPNEPAPMAICGCTWITSAGIVKTCIKKLWFELVASSLVKNRSLVLYITEACFNPIL